MEISDWKYVDNHDDISIDLRPSHNLRITNLAELLYPGTMDVTLARMKKIPSVEHLHGLGNSLYSSGKAKEAIESFDSALLMMETERRLWDGAPVKGPTSLSRKLLYSAINSHSVSLHRPPDSFYEGECDVGPRPIHSPLHIDYSSLPTLEEIERAHV